MSAPNFHILPYDPRAWQHVDNTLEEPSTTLEINFEDFSLHLQEKWHNCTIVVTASSLVWNIFNGDDEIFGGKIYNKYIVYFSQYPARMAVDFALWFRDYIDSKYDLFMFLTGNWSTLQLKQDTRAEDVATFFQLEL